MHGFPFVLSGGGRSQPAVSARWIQPSRALRSHVSAIAYVDNRADALCALPASGALLAIRFQGDVFDGSAALAAVSLTGIQRSVRHFHYAGPVRSVLLRLTPQATSSFGADAVDLIDRTAGLADLGISALACLPEQLSRADNTASVLDCLERALLPLPLRSDLVVDRAVALLSGPSMPGDCRALNGPSVARTARELGISERQLVRRFIAAVGMPPKRFAALRRLERALRLLPRSTTCAEVAHAVGYFDEAHFSRECTRITGESPTTLRRSQRSEIRYSMSDSYK